MDHAEAVQTNATERYLLGELNAAEVDAFEEHYFDCMSCADDVRTGVQLLDGGRQLVREPASTKTAVVSMAAHRARRSGRTARRDRQVSLYDSSLTFPV